jgi:YegS/Rv2252/BmrU family lipid kinase
MKKKVTVIVNPISGTKDKTTIKTLIDNRLDRNIYDVRIVTTQYAGHGAEIAGVESLNGTDIVVAVGGDGTVNEIGRALVDTNTVMGIIPCGSGNGLARHLHIPMNVKEAIDVINAGRQESIDYGRINKHPFFCTCGVGFDAFVSMDFAKKGSRGLLTYMETALQDFLKYKPEIYQLTADDHVMEYKAFLVAVANASQYGNNAYIAPKATLTDGLLDVIIMAPFKPYDVPILAYRLFNKMLDGSPLISKISCKHLAIHREKPGSVHFDGEPFEADKDIDIRIFPHGLNIIVPPDFKEI